ncbi:unnamed protein product [Paramecium octaurelia]|uniref:Tetratricopeptide repeat protein n=2 Tax=Paramecium octaurelia TaxID=43137 RepID=A0A8S1YQB0_PAROT|nr:unnamed protein product [Paramecium octaurelia]
MQQMNADTIKCPNSEHANDVKLICFNESCKANRLYCIQCMKDGTHISHPQNQQELPMLFEFIEKTEKECNDWMTSLNQQMDLAQQSFYFLLEGIRSKYQKTKEQFLNLNSKQMNSFFVEIIQFKSVQQTIKDQIENSIKELQNQMEKLTYGLKLSELNYCSISDSNIQKSEELYKKGYQLYWNDDNYKEAIKMFDQALIFNSTHQLSLQCKAQSLKMLGQYNEAIIWIDKALQVDPKHCNSLYCKAESLRMLGQFNEAIIWADKALEIDPKHCSSLFCKGTILTQLRMFNEAMLVIEQSLSINPNNFDSLWSKGLCLQQQNQFKDAITFYEKALTIIPNHQWTKNRRDECLKALNNKSLFKFLKIY